MRLETETRRISDHDSRVVGAICVALAAIVWMGFGQTIGHHFINYDDDMYVYQNRDVLRGLTPPGSCLVIHIRLNWALASGDVVVSHAGLPAFWALGRGTSSD